MDIKEVVKIAKRRIKASEFVNINHLTKELKPNDDKAFRNSVIKTMTKSGKYIQESQQDGIVISKNPNYKNQWVHDIGVAIISSILSLTVGIILWQLDSRQKSQELLQLQLQLTDVESKVDSLTNEAMKMDSDSAQTR